MFISRFRQCLFAAAFVSTLGPFATSHAEISTAPLELSVSITDDQWSIGSGDALIEMANDDPAFQAAQHLPPSALSPDNATLVGISLHNPNAKDQGASRALPFLENACERGQMRACRNAGWHHEIIQSMPIAIDRYKQACSGGNGWACIDWLRTDKDTPFADDDVRAALKHVRSACERDIQAACLTSAALDIKNDNLDQAIPIVTKTCTSGSPETCYNFAFHLGRAGAHEDAANAYDAACAKDYIRACQNLGRLHTLGLTGTVDEAAGVKLFQKGCDARLPDACEALGLAYLNGRGVEADAGKAQDLLSKTCKYGMGRACRVLGEALLNGNKVEQDTETALRYFAMACELGEGESCRGLAYMFEQGEILAKDAELSAHLLQRACDFNDQWACKQLAAKSNASSTTLTIDVNGKTETCDTAIGRECLDLAASLMSGPNRVLGIDTYMKTCNAGVAAGCLNAGMFLTKGDEIDQKNAAKMFKQGCDLADTMSCMKHRSLAQLPAAPTIAN